MDKATTETERLRIVELKEEDMEDVFALNSKEDVARFNTIGIPKDIGVTKELYKTYFESKNTDDQNELAWTVRLKAKDRFIGEIGLKLAPERFKSAEIRFNLDPEFWGQGYATEAANAVLDYAFNTLDLHRIEAGCSAENKASIAVLEKLGMRKEGSKRKALPLRTGWSDNYEYAILEEDYFSEG